MLHKAHQYTESVELNINLVRIVYISMLISKLDCSNIKTATAINMFISITVQFLK